MDCVTIKDESQDVPQELEMFDDFDLGPREFHVLDKFEAADKEGGEESDSSSYNEDVDSDSEAEIHEDEIDAMLDEGRLVNISSLLSLQNDQGFSSRFERRIPSQEETKEE